MNTEKIPIVRYVEYCDEHCSHNCELLEYEDETDTYNCLLTNHWLVKKLDNHSVILLRTQYCKELEKAYKGA